MRFPDIHSHVAELTYRESISPRMKELDEMIAEHENKPKQIRGACCFCGRQFQSTSGVRMHERICRSRPKPEIKRRGRSKAEWMKELRVYLHRAGVERNAGGEACLKLNSAVGAAETVMRAEAVATATGI